MRRSAYSVLLVLAGCTTNNPGFVLATDGVGSGTSNSTAMTDDSSVPGTTTDSPTSEGPGSAGSGEPSTLGTTGPIDTGDVDTGLVDMAAIDLDLGAYNGCMVVALDAAANEVRCWGAWDDGVLLDTPMDIGDAPGENPVPIPFAKANPQVVRVGYQHGCALMQGGSVRCWGDDSHQQLGQSTPAKDVFFGDGITIERLAVGGYHSCAVTTDHDVYCWGLNGDQQLGFPEVGDYATPTKVNLGQKVKSVDLGYDFGCALLESNRVKCWGMNNAGQCGYPPVTAHVKPSDPVAIPGDFIAISASLAHACGLKAEGSVACWGANENGQLGAEVQGPGFEVPLQSKLVYPARLIATGTRHSCAVLDTDGGPGVTLRAKCWGAGNLGQRGTGDIISVGENQGSMGEGLAAVILPETFVASRIVSALDTSCALSMAGQVTCWGANEYGRLGLGVSVTESIGDEPDEMGDNLLFVPIP